MSSENPDSRLGKSVTDHENLALFHRTLAELCRAEVPLPRAFRLLDAELGRGKLSSAAASMLEEVEAGTSFEEAYDRRRDVFPPLYRTLVRAGAASGDLPAVLEEIARHAALRARTADRIRRALTPPIVTAVFVFLIGGLAFLFGAGRFREFVEATGSDPTFSDLYRLGPAGGGDAGISSMVISLVAFLVLILFVTGSFRLSWLNNPLDRARGFRIPVIGPLRLASARASLASTLSLLLARRVPLPEALSLAALASDGGRMAERVRAMARDAERGKGLAETLRAGGVFEPSTVWLVETADGSAHAAQALGDVARIYRQRLDRGLDRFAVLVRPVAEVLIGIAVLLFAMSYVVPVYDLVKDIIG